MNDYARNKMAENSNPNRENYSLINNNCATFALDVLKQDSNVKDNAPDLLIKSPNNIVDELQEKFDAITFENLKDKR